MKNNVARQPKGRQMKYYMAPLEGITVHTYRNAYNEYFGGIDKYFTPFIAAEGSLKMKKREIKDILPENNEGIYLVPQIISNNADNFIRFAHLLRDRGYKEINFNLGCPSGTVVSRHKGAGFLAKPDELDVFFDKIFNALADMDISVKTRIGVNDENEIYKIMEIYNRYPIYELIVHPRIRADYYSNSPRMDIFRYIYDVSNCPVCYNGDIKYAADYARIAGEYTGLSAVMTGRGLIRNPMLARSMKERAEALSAKDGEEVLSAKDGAELLPARDTLRQFHDRIYGEYKSTMPGERVVIYKMKEIWIYMIDIFDDDGSYMRLLKKTGGLSDYNVFVNRIFSECPYTGHT